MRKYLVYAVVALAALVIAVTLIGYSLPQSHVATGSRVVPLTPDATFARITDLGRYPEWRKEVSSVEVMTADPLTWREVSGGDTITYRVVERVPASRFVVMIADPDLPFGGTWTYELAPEGTGTRVTITERGEVYNPIFRFMSRFVFGHTATIDRVLAAIG